MSDELPPPPPGITDGCPKCKGDRKREPCAYPDACHYGEAMPEDTKDALERGKLSGEHDRQQGRRYGKVHGVYPSNPYHVSDPRYEVFNTAWEAAWKRTGQ